MKRVRISPIANPSFRGLFAAQVSSLLAVGLMTVALSLSAYRIGGVAAAGQILGFLLAVKMVAYVGIAPIAEAILAGRKRKQVMIALDLSRMALLLPMAFATDVWQIAVLALFFFAVSAGFTPLFQSLIPEILPDEEIYSRALVWSRLAYTLEAIASPIIAAILLQLVAAEFLFWFAASAFVMSVVALAATRFPADAPLEKKGPFLDRALKGLRIYRHTPRLRGLFILNFALSLSMAWVLVNTVVVAGSKLGDPERFLPILMAFYGLGVAIGAVLVPQHIAWKGDRSTMVHGALLHAALGLGVVLPLGLWGYAGLWIGFGIASSLVLTPGGLVIARSAETADRPAVFAAQFSLSHAGWLIAYPLAGQAALWIGLEHALLALSLLTALLTIFSTQVWPAHDPLVREHEHPELPPDHAHLLETPASGSRHRHKHAYRINVLHPRWNDVNPAQ
ncbi:MFS transporter [Roseobacter sp.]|uniref:MFS transporter n=1 Tax=Roseobacter sp. TaxID=1907202 RepID=UPI00385A8280